MIRIEIETNEVLYPEPEHTTQRTGLYPLSKLGELYRQWVGDRSDPSQPSDDTDGSMDDLCGCNEAVECRS
ncbi:MAG: hypothetical protein GYB68_02770 [Chloroflexi bacterium]|nr:hypothetical protein [Chloroflexota bacterium]